ncbi:MAG TPA: 50S ribosomal protein L30 [Thermoanaerobaculia bacterium]|nr:50S ribosomal protein L30 [Thermoanaerobaculia bacterium]
MADNQEGKKIRIRQVRSSIGTKREHREVLRGLGLRRIRHEVVREDTPAVRGMVNKVSYLLEVHEEQS